MKLIKPSVEYIPQEEVRIYTHEDLYHHIDKCARVCYKSEGNYNPDKSKDFVEGLIKRGHLTPLEHVTVYLTLNHGNKLYHELHDKYKNNPYSKVVNKGDNCYITTNFRVLQENGWLEDLTYRSFDTEYHVKRYTMKFITDIAICRELLRHRKFSFANESTRYCNYSKGKFGGELTFITPTWYTGGNGTNDKECFMDSEFELSCEEAEKSYLRMIGWGATPQEARQVLPLATKTELVMTGFEDDWSHFMDLRLRGTTGKPHPDMQYIAQLVWDEFKDNLNLEL